MQCCHATRLPQQPQFIGRALDPRARGFPGGRVYVCRARATEVFVPQQIGTLAGLWDQLDPCRETRNTKTRRRWRRRSGRRKSKPTTTTPHNHLLTAVTAGGAQLDWSWHRAPGGHELQHPSQVRVTCFLARRLRTSFDGTRFPAKSRESGTRHAISVGLVVVLWDFSTSEISRFFLGFTGFWFKATGLSTKRDAFR